MAGGKPAGGDADCTAFAGAVGGGDCGGGDKSVVAKNQPMIRNQSFTASCKRTISSSAIGQQ